MIWPRNTDAHVFPIYLTDRQTRAFQQGLEDDARLTQTRPARPAANQSFSLWTSAKPTLLPFHRNGAAHRTPEHGTQEQINGSK
jgi:hypothetical protein